MIKYVTVLLTISKFVAAKSEYNYNVNCNVKNMATMTRLLEHRITNLPKPLNFCDIQIVCGLCCLYRQEIGILLDDLYYSKGTGSLRGPMNNI